jgi:hypothetical protein
VAPDTPLFVVEVVWLRPTTVAELCVLDILPRLKPWDSSGEDQGYDEKSATVRKRDVWFDVEGAMCGSMLKILKTTVRPSVSQTLSGLNPE